MENEVVLEKLKGTVEDVSFFNEDTGFCVAEINTGEEAVTVVGAIGELAIGCEAEFNGVWDFHPSFGRQFKAETVHIMLPADAGGILRYLSSGIIRGVREATAAKIVERFGSDTFNVMENEPERLAEIKGITKTKALKISENFRMQFAAREMLMELTSLGMTQNEAIKAYGIFKGETLDIVRENPYALIGIVKGVDFDKADDIASRLDEAPPYDYRAQAGIVHILRHNLGNGHTCIPRNKIFTPAKELLGCGDDYIDIILDNAIDANVIIEKEVRGKPYLFLPDIYNAEASVADRIKTLVSYPPRENVIFGSEISAFEEANGIEFDEKQREAIEIAVKKGLLILTGGPGTGKTTTVKGIITLMKSRGLEVALTAPTGRAAQRMQELTGYEAKTIHRLLEVEFKENGETPTFVHNMRNPLECDAVIVDELSMVDITLFSALLEAMPVHCRLIMVGDKDQLPPVGAGNVLKDLTESGVISVITLDKIFRQAMKSRIVTNAHRVVKGEMPVIDNSADSDFFLMKEVNKYNVAKKVISLVAHRLPESYGLLPMSDIQVLCPSKQGEAGTQNLNASLQQVLNPPAPEKRELHYKGYTLREGDRVMQIKNNYDVPWFKGSDTGQGVFNGDIGILKTINSADNVITVMYDDKEALYSFESVRELELAYAMTVHKSQGSEFPAVVMPVVATPELLSYRNLFYTALTRAKQLIVIIGSEQNIEKMVSNDKKAKRFSALKYFIENSTDI
nr:ATP-dependent RecD-like DNA helicase [Eubacterium sp.]